MITKTQIIAASVGAIVTVIIALLMTLIFDTGLHSVTAALTGGVTGWSFAYLIARREMRS